MALGLGQDWHTPVRAAAEGITSTRSGMSLNADAMQERPRGVRAALLVWVGLFALFRGISEIVIAFDVRSRQRG